MTIQAKVLWERKTEENFLVARYSRVHHWHLDGGAIIPASASPEIVPVPFSDPTLIDPEEAYVASISSCHMLFFLSIAAKKKLVIERYEDNPEGTLGKNEQGKTAVLSVVLRPKVWFGGTSAPSRKTIEHIHELAHSECFIANSVRTKITIEGMNI